MNVFVALVVLVLAGTKSPAVRYVNPAGPAKSPRYSHVTIVNRGELILISRQIARGEQGDRGGS